MKKIVSVFGIFFCVLSVAFSQQKPSAQTNAQQAPARTAQTQRSSGFAVGDTGPAGGIIVYADGNTYLECSEILGTANWQNAVALCKNYNGGGFNDWRLPSREELDRVYEQLGNAGVTGSNDWFWSSSQRNSKYAWVERFNSGRHYGAFKSNAYLVRAVRSFSK